MSAFVQSSAACRSLPDLPLAPTPFHDGQGFVENVSTILPGLLAKVFHWLTTDASDQALFAYDLQWAYVQVLDRYDKSDTTYRSIKRDHTQYHQCLRDVRRNFEALRDRCKVILTEVDRDLHHAFVPKEHDHARSPVVYVTTNLLDMLRRAPTKEQQHHLLLFLFITICRELGHLTGRFLYGPKFTTPDTKRSKVTSRAPYKGEQQIGEGGECIELAVFYDELLHISIPEHDADLVSAFRIRRASDLAYLNDAHVQQMNSMLFNGEEVRLGPLFRDVDFQRQRKGLLPPFINEAQQRLALGASKSQPEPLSNFSTYAPASRDLTALMSNMSPSSAIPSASEYPSVQDQETPLHQHGQRQEHSEDSVVAFGVQTLALIHECGQEEAVQPDIDVPSF